MSGLSYRDSAIGGAASAASLGTTTTSEVVIQKVTFLETVVHVGANAIYTWNDVIAMVGGVVGVVIIIKLIFGGLKDLYEKARNYFVKDKD